MYGLVNKAVEGLVRRDHGDAVWDAIRSRANVEDVAFVATEQYDDQLTYALVGAAAEILAVPATAVLRAFGEYWILEIAARQYRRMFSSSGDGLREFLHYLPMFHTRVTLVLPKLVPPTFEVTDDTETGLTLHYISERRGLQEFVVGLLFGLGKYFETAIDVAHVVSRDDGAPHDQFRVTWK